MMFGLDSVTLFLVAVYTAITFGLALTKPNLALILIIPIFGLGFGEAEIIKGGFLAVVLGGLLLNNFLEEKKIRVDRKLGRLIGLVMLYMAWVGVRGIYFDDFGSFPIWFWLIRRVGGPMIAAMLVVILARDEKDIMRFVFGLMAFIVVSALIGIMQYGGIFEWGWTVRESLGILDLESIQNNIGRRVRIVGLSSFVVPFSYQLTAVAPLIMAWAVTKNRFKKYQPLFLVGFFIVMITMTLTFVRSALLGALIGGGVVLVLAIKMGLIRRLYSELILLGVALGLIGAVGLGGVSGQVFRIGDTTYERIPVTMAAGRVFWGNPGGVGYEYLEAVEKIYDKIDHLPEAEAALRLWPHNIILSAAVMFGWPAVLLIIYFYFYLLRYLYEAARENNRDVRILAIGLMGSFTAYLINASFHNANPFLGDPFNWLFIGAAWWTIRGVRERVELIND